MKEGKTIELNKAPFKKKRLVKLTVKGLAGALLVTTILGMVTGGGLVRLDPNDANTVWMTKGRYVKLIKKLKEEFEAGRITSLTLMYGASNEMKVYRAILDKEAQSGAFENIETSDGLLEAMIHSLKP